MKKQKQEKKPGIVKRVLGEAWGFVVGLVTREIAENEVMPFLHIPVFYKDYNRKSRTFFFPVGVLALLVVFIYWLIKSWVISVSYRIYIMRRSVQMHMHDRKRGVK